MPDAASRRDLLKAGVAGVTTLAMPASLLAQGSPSTPTPTVGSMPLPTAEDLGRQLGHPLPEEAKRLLKAALEANQHNALERLKTKLAEGSEPCARYQAVGVPERS